MERIFKGSIFTLGGMFLASAILFGIGVAVPEGTPLYGLALGTLVAVLCSSPLVMLTALVSGIGSLIRRTSGKSKRKNDFDTFGLDESDMVLDDIMSQLSPEQQEYLQRRLRKSRLGVGNDGELISINDLLNDYEEEQRGRM